MGTSKSVVYWFTGIFEGQGAKSWRKLGHAQTQNMNIENIQDGKAEMLKPLYLKSSSVFAVSVSEGEIWMCLPIIIMYCCIFLQPRTFNA